MDLDKFQQLDILLSSLKEEGELYRIKAPKIVIFQKDIVIKVDRKSNYKTMLEVCEAARKKNLEYFFEQPKLQWEGEILIVYSQNRVSPISQMEEFYEISQTVHPEAFLKERYRKLYEFCKEYPIKDLTYWNMGFDRTHSLRIFDYDY